MSLFPVDCLLEWNVVVLWIIALPKEVRSFIMEHKQWFPDQQPGIWLEMQSLSPSLKPSELGYAYSIQMPREVIGSLKLEDWLFR